MKIRCVWDGWNRGHATRHGVSGPDIEYVVSHASPPDPEYLGTGKYRVRGHAPDGRYVQIVFVHKSTEQIDFEMMSIEELVHFESAKGPYA